MTLSARRADALSRDLARGGRSARARALDVGADAAEQRRAWTWGRKLGTPRVVEIEMPPARLAWIATVERTWYRAAKGPNAPRELYVHDHRAPFQVLGARPWRPGVRTLSSRGTIPRGPAVSYLGELVEIEGHDDQGRAVRVQFSGVTLAGDPQTDRMLLLGPPGTPWIILHGSPCKVTEKGLIL